MIRLAEIVAQYAPEMRNQSGPLLHSQRAALSAFQNCRSATSPKMQLVCTALGVLVPFNRVKVRLKLYMYCPLVMRARCARADLVISAKAHQQ